MRKEVGIVRKSKEMSGQVKLVRNSYVANLAIMHQPVTINST